MSTPKTKPAQGRSFFIAELYRAAMMLDISDQAHRILTAILANTNMVANDPDYQTTYVGQDWIALHVGRDQKSVSRYIGELVSTRILTVERRGNNITNRMHVDVELIRKLGSERHKQALAELRASQATKSKEKRSRTKGSDIPNLPYPVTPNLPYPVTPNLGGDLVSLNLVSNDPSEPTVASPPASPSSQATLSSRASTQRKSQDPKGFDEASIASWESLEVLILSKLEQLRIDGLTTSERINAIHKSLLVKRYTIGSELLTAYERGLTEAHEAQIASEWIMKVVLSPASDPSRYVTTLRAFIVGKADMLTTSAESRIMKQRRANAS